MCDLQLPTKDVIVDVHVACIQLRTPKGATALFLITCSIHLHVTIHIVIRSL